MAITAIAVAVDREEYSVYERARRTVRVNWTATGAGAGLNYYVEIRKARRERDVVVVQVTIAGTTSSTYALNIRLDAILDEDAIPLVNPGDYFVRVSAVADATVYGESDDFRVACVTLASVREGYLHGIGDGKALDILLVKNQPVQVTGVSVIGVSARHPQKWLVLSYTGPAGAASLTGTAAAGSTTTVVNWTGGGLSVNARVGQWLVHAGVPRQVLSNTTSALTLTVALPTAPAASDALILRSDQQRTLSWCGGPALPVTPTRTAYTLRTGDQQVGAGVGYIDVEVVWDDLPVVSASEELLIEGAPLNTRGAWDIIDAAYEATKTSLDIYLDVTKIVTDITPGSTVAGTTIPAFASADWDEVVTPVSHDPPQVPNYVAIQFPYAPILKIDSLTGYLVNRQTLTIDPSWIQHHEMGLIQITPFISSAAVNAIAGWAAGPSFRSGMTIPNFWHFEVRVGFRQVPKEIRDIVAMRAASKILAIAGQATLNAISSESLSRDGVTQSRNYTTSAMYGVYSASERKLDEAVKFAERVAKDKYSGHSFSVI